MLEEEHFHNHQDENPLFDQIKMACHMIIHFGMCLFLVTCVIMQKNGAGLHTASSCFWDNSTDGKETSFPTPLRSLAIKVKLKPGLHLGTVTHNHCAYHRPCIRGNLPGNF